ncbi:MAG TPA: SRPBCC domain-containing protein [Acidimicrobiia bacterium]|nr:SRPBCC domain-containing protein [Acidimicrobiia bacterium]
MIEDTTVVHELVLPAPPEAVFAMFVEPEQLVRWIGISADLEPRPGGRFRFEVMPGQHCEGSFVTVDPPHRLVFTWGWTEASMGVAPGSSSVEVTFTAQGENSTRLRLVHSGLETGDSRLLHDDGWNRFLSRLLAVVSGRSAPEYPSELPEERLPNLVRDTPG